MGGEGNPVYSGGQPCVPHYALQRGVIFFLATWLFYLPLDCP